MKAIVTYHSIDGSGSVISIDRDTFRHHIEWLCSAQVPIRPLAEVIRAECTEGIALTFDDGFENFASQAWPVLREYGLPATVFVVSDQVGGQNGWDPTDTRVPRLPLMDWATLSTLASEGVELGGHTRGHPDLLTLEGDALLSEVRGCHTEIAARIGRQPAAFAYPYGHYGPDTVAAVAEAGFTTAVTTEMALLGSDPPADLEVPRLDAFYLRQRGVLERWGTPSFRRFVWMRAGARRIRRVLARTGVGS